MNNFAAWREWGELCAADLCSESTKDALRAFARTRWQAHLNHWGNNSPESGEVTGNEAWHRFETHCVVKTTRAGKSYKSWLFQRIASLTEGTPVDIIESGACGIMRWAVRDFIRNEGRVRLPGRLTPERSLEDVVPGSDGRTFGDLLPDQVDVNSELERREYERLADDEASQWFLELSDRQRIVVTAWALGIALSNPEVEKIAGCKKSVLSDELKKTFQSIAVRINTKYVDEDPLGRECLVRFMLRAIVRICTQPDNRPETWRSHLFSIATKQD